MRRATVFRNLTLGGCALVSLGGTCDSSPTGVASVQNCGVIYDAGWPTSGDLTFNKPARCPFQLSGATYVPFAGHAKLLDNIGVTYQNYEAICLNYFGNTCGDNITSSWTDVGGYYHVDVSGTYQAGTGGFPVQNPRDLVRNRFFKNGNFIYATAELVYKFGATNVGMTGPTNGLGGGLNFSVQAWSEDPLQVGNATFAWYKDGSYVTTTGSVGSDSYSEYTFTTDVGATSHEIGVTITDELGVAHSSSFFVTVCPFPQFTC